MRYHLSVEPRNLVQAGIIAIDLARPEIRKFIELFPTLHEHDINEFGVHNAGTRLCEIISKHSLNSKSDKKSPQNLKYPLSSITSMINKYLSEYKLHNDICEGGLLSPAEKTLLDMVYFINAKEISLSGKKISVKRKDGLELLIEQKCKDAAEVTITGSYGAKKYISMLRQEEAHQEKAGNSVLLPEIIKEAGGKLSLIEKYRLASNDYRYGPLRQPMARNGAYLALTGAYMFTHSDNDLPNIAALTFLFVSAMAVVAFSAGYHKVPEYSILPNA